MSVQGNLKKKSRLRYLKYLVYLSPILAVFIGYAAISVVTNESLPFTIVTGTSMQPTIVAGSIAVIDKVPFNQLQIGDVIVFVPLLAESNACDSGPTPTLTSEAAVPCYVIHRIVRIQQVKGQEILTTKGDNNPGSIPFIDEDINSSMYVGKVVFEIPIAGYVTESPYNYLIALIILLLLVAEFYYERNAPRTPKIQEQTNA
ncbi:MAG TPA: signal peptidase I [Nitrososphaerales archaeon]|nr:signal peptidase I [Nitrososphaerales archaeon]